MKIEYFEKIIIMLFLVMIINSMRPGIIVSQEENHSSKPSLQLNHRDTRNAENIIGELLKIMHRNDSYEKWSSENKANCVPFENVTTASDPEGLWCYRCYVRNNYFRATFTFYADIAKDACTLQNMESILYIAEESALEEVLKTAETFFGKSEKINADKMQEYEWENLEGAALKFESQNGVAFLKYENDSETCSESDDYCTSIPNQEANYDLDFGNGSIKCKNPPPIKEPACYRLTWMGYPLLTEEKYSWENFYGHGSPIDNHQLEQREKAFEACMSAKLKKCDNGYVGLMEHKVKLFDASFNEVLAHLKKMKVSDNQYPALVYWMDYLARNLLNFYRPDTKRIQGLASFGLHYVNRERYMPYFSREQFKSIALKRQDSPWGRAAFIEMSEEVWRSDYCYPEDMLEGAGTLQELKELIRREEDFLEKYPDEEVSAAVQQHLASLYESWWSLSKRNFCSDYDLDDESFISPEAEEARLKAIALYENYLKKHVENGDQGLIKITLFKLKHKIDTCARYVSWCD